MPKTNCDGRPLLLDLKREVDLVELHTDVIEQDVDDEVRCKHVQVDACVHQLQLKPKPLLSGCLWLLH